MGNKTKKQKFDQGGSKKSGLFPAAFGSDPIAQIDALIKEARRLKKNQDKGKKYKNLLQIKKQIILLKQKIKVMQK